MAQKAPGKSHRKGLTLQELFRMFPDDATAERWFAEKRWPDGPHCPYCGSTNVQSSAKHKTMPYRCREKTCAKRFSVRTKTPMESSKLGFQTWAVALYQVTTNLKGVSSMKLHRDLGITQRSAWFLAHRLREAWKDHGSQFTGPVEVDETYIGGLEKNKHAHKKQRLGRGGIGKTAIAGAMDRATGAIRGEVIPDTTKRTLHGFVASHATPDATIYTHEGSGYHGLPFDHETVCHGVGEYVDGMTHTNGIESFWSMLKRAHKGTFHKISPKHLQRYVTEFSGRHNDREADTISQMGKLVSAMQGKRLKYRDLVAL